MTATMTITKNAEGKLAGTWSTQRGESQLSDITFENGKLKFVQTNSFGGQEMKTTYEGTVDGTKITGKGKRSLENPLSMGLYREKQKREQMRLSACGK